VFDLKADTDSKHHLNSDDIDIIKPHRVYLYRDGIRVYPYGDAEDDWLGIDIARGTVSAGAFLSNDQVIGCIDITHAGNPDLRDKTSREGLVDEGAATEDFRAVIRTFLSYIRKQPFTAYRQIVEKRRLQKALEEGRTTEVFADLLAHLDRQGDSKACKIARSVERAYNTEKQVLEQRAKTTEELAAVGIAVETSSHDLMLMMGRALEAVDLLTNSAIAVEDPIHEHFDDLQKVRGMLSFIEQRMKDLQSLFKSSKQRRHSIRVREVLDKVAHIYRSSFHKDGIVVDIQEVGPPLIAKCTDAVLMQLFINLFDNALYWLRDSHPKERRVVVKLDGDEGTLIFADNGPGVITDLVPYIFDPFVSGKGDDGRGLGLYIARQLLERMDYSIELVDKKRDRILKGACFIVSFVQQESMR
jgi:signal transduction histidine kinase